MSTGIMALLTTLIWLVAIHEFQKPERKQNNRIIILSTAARSLLTLVLTISLFQSLSF
ncbi:hypothetical protein N5C46_09990 [Rossellomorea vietnamensis]|uniref:Uncharacterized protein n=1 Tax=Rossellomorea vietnamensis TaxID=218284 RepID=A0ACD4CD49_9BACI|nr:hypothetical protein [Rossellomorea vietnamensis]UXH46344.1 hypothetical protein N5C46_09990 [Rossellomorea vietnamensis]